jgi:hypothetical protein
MRETSMYKSAIKISSTQAQGTQTKETPTNYNLFTSANIFSLKKKLDHFKNGDWLFFKLQGV